MCNGEKVFPATLAREILPEITEYGANNFAPLERPVNSFEVGDADQVAASVKSSGWSRGAATCPTKGDWWKQASPAKRGSFWTRFREVGYRRFLRTIPALFFLIGDIFANATGRKAMPTLIGETVNAANTAPAYSNIILDGNNFRCTIPILSRVISA